MRTRLLCRFFHGVIRNGCAPGCSPRINSWAHNAVMGHEPLLVAAIAEQYGAGGRAETGIFFLGALGLGNGPDRALGDDRARRLPGGRTPGRLNRYGQYSGGPELRE